MFRNKFRNLLRIHAFTECKCVITKPLEDIEITKGSTVKLSIGISKQRQVTWKKNGQEVVRDDRFRVTVSDDGLDHALSIVNVSLEDNAEIAVEINDNIDGTIKSSCTLTVKGKINYRL